MSKEQKQKYLDRWVSGDRFSKEELEILTRWILEDKFRLVTIVGLKGIGKNFLSVKLTEKIKDKFEFVIWRSLSLAPKISAFIDLVYFYTSP